MKNNSSRYSIYTSITHKVISLASRSLWLSLFGFISIVTPALAETLERVGALALHGEPKYKEGFTHVDYANPEAPKGGELKLGVVGSFDSLNPYIIKGLPASGIGLTSMTLLEKSLDEPLSSYGLLAEKMSVAEDRSWITFYLRKEAKWDDGQPITADDVTWSFETLLKKGQPFFRSYYSQVSKVEKIDDHTVKFVFKKAGNREMPLIVGDIPVLPKHYWTEKNRDFSKTTLEPSVGCGPYHIKTINAGRQIVYERNKDWWAKDLPINKGRYNFDTIVFDYYRDPGVAFQAFLSGNIDFRQENIAKNWAQGYDHPAVKSGKVVRDEIKHGLPSGMQGFVYNTRREIFKDPKVREALAYAFDFEWSNKQFAFGSYSRSYSYFSNSDLAANKPMTMEETALLEPYRSQVPSRVFSDIYQPPKTNGSGDIRQNLRTALGLLKEAGWTLQNGTLKNKDGKAFEFEILTDTGMFDRWILPFVANLKKLGIKATLREIDAAQMQNRTNDFDFDMTISVYGQSLTPGNEQIAYWGSEMADTAGSQNLAGVKDPAVDAMINKIIHAETRDSLITASRSLDRLLLWNFYVIPQWYSGTFRIAYWNKLDHPNKNPPYGLPVLETWWAKASNGKTE